MTSIDKARDILMGVGIPVISIFEIEEGANHSVFEVQVEGKPNLVLKCGLNGETDEKPRKDPLFGGEMSLGRELSVFSALEKKKSLKIPGIVSTDGHSYVLMEKLKGRLFGDFLAKNGYDEKLFLNTMDSLGEVFARLHRVTFPTFGDLLSEDRIGSARDNYADRFKDILYYRLQRGIDKGAISFEEAKEIRCEVLTRIEKYRNRLDATKTPAVIVMDDMHPENFFVDDNGLVTGFFDVEFAQAAHPSLEYYSLCIYLFNLMDISAFKKARETFGASYRRCGGKFDFSDPLSEELTSLSAVSRFVELACSYHGVADGLRDSWANRYKILIRRFLDTGEVDYMEASKMQKEKLAWRLGERL